MKTLPLHEQRGKYDHRNDDTPEYVNYWVHRARVVYELQSLVTASRYALLDSSEAVDAILEDATHALLDDVRAECDKLMRLRRRNRRRTLGLD